MGRSAASWLLALSAACRCCSCRLSLCFADFDCCCFDCSLPPSLMPHFTSLSIPPCLFLLSPFSLTVLDASENFTDKATKQTGGQPVNFEGEPPKGYALFKKSDNSIHGHPNHKPYRSVKAFVDHVHAIMTESLGTCVCELCVEARGG